MTFVRSNNQQTTVSGVWYNPNIDYTRLLINVQDVSSLSTSKLLDVKYNNSSFFSIGKSGVITIPTTGSTIYMGGAYRGLAVGNCAINYGTDGVIAGPGGFIFINGSIDNREFTLIRDAENTLAQRNGTAAQTFRLYNTYGGSPAGTDREYASFSWNANRFEIETEASGAGSARQLVIGTSGTPRMFFSGTGHRVDIGGDLNGAAGLGEAFVSLNGYGNSNNNIVLRFYSHSGWTDYRIQSGINKNLVFTGRNSAQPQNGAGFDFYCRSEAVSGLTGGLGAEGQIRLYGKGTDGTYGGFFRLVAFNDNVNARLGDVDFQFSQDIYGLNSSISKWYRSGITEFYNTKRIYASSGFNTSATLLDLSATWNTPATPTAIKLNVVDTSSNANSLLMDLQVGGSSRFKVDKNGIVSTSAITSTSISSTTISATSYLNLPSNIQSAGALTVSAPTTTALTVVGTQAQNNGFFSAAGDADKISYVMRAITKNGSSVEMFLDGASTRQIIPANTSWNATVRIVAKTDKFENRYATFDRKLLISKGDTNAATQIIGPVQVLGIDTGSTAGSPPAGWAVALTADTTNGSLKINVTGEIGTYVRWVANVDLVEVGYEGSFSERTESLFANGEEGVWFDASGFDPAWRRNLLLHTEDFSNTVWQKSGAGALVSGSTVAAPDGTFTASTVYLPTGGGATQFYQILPTGQFGNVPVTQNIWMRSSTNNQITFGFYDSPNSDVSTVTLTSNWQQYTITKRSGFTSTFNDRRALWLYLGPAGTANIDIWHPQLEYGLSATPYQRIVTPDITFKSDIQRLPTLYQDTEGVTPVTNVEQTVGMILDKSKNFERGPELAISDYTQWASSTNFIRTTTGLSAINAVQFESVQLLNVPYVQNAWYEVTFDVTIVTGIASVQLGNSGQSPSITEYSGQSFRKTAILYYPTTNGNRITIRAETAGATFYVNYLSIRQLKGSHATQAISANRPTLRARYNLLTYSEQFDNAAWPKTNTGNGALPIVSANAGIDPNGTNTADRIQFNLNGGTTTSDLSIIRQNIDLSALVTYSIYVKPFNSASSFNMLIVDPSSNGFPITVSGSNWTRFSVSGNQNGTVQYGLRLRGGQTPVNSDTADVLVWGAQLEYGTSATRYQRIAAATDYDTAGFLPYFSFDGDNDFLSTNTVSLSSTDKLHIAAGVTTFGFKNTATNRNLISFGNILAAGASAGSFSIAYDSGTPYPIVPRIAGSISGISYYPDSSSLSISPAPKTMVYTQLFDMAQTSVSSEYNMRINGTPVISTTFGGTDSAGTFGSYTINIGHRNSGAWLYGNLYSLIVRGTSTNNTLIPLIEKYVAQQSGVTLP